MLYFILFSGFGIHLTEILLDTRYPLPVRQLATVLLKQYVDVHWSKLCEEKYRPPEALPEAKSVIRDLLPRGLEDPNSKIRAGVAHAISGRYLYFKQISYNVRWHARDFFFVQE